ncbi:uncharacterized protein LOC130808356 [Amaranthus tricolor]|uniref:uncharacterized protein LOC130808356 n=1 Tax=Amaranthus tricolor TaxID=29722 RepID=UPI002584AAA7|nr:uncharacterized protein LOC130808356 [Amaranthus tricolor]
MEQMFQMFQKLNKANNQTENPTSLKISEKLTYHNYTKWCKLMHVAIGGRGRLSHITAGPPPPSDPNYIQWEQRDAMVKAWIIENIDGDIVNQFLDYTTAHSLWQGIETLLGCGRDELQIFDLSSKAATLRQDNDTIEGYYGKLNILWKEIDRRMPNPMTCPQDITEFNKYIQRQRLYQFLTGINDNLDKERREILNSEPLPMVETAYASIRREITRRKIMNSVSSPGTRPSEIGLGLATRNKTFQRSREEDDRRKLRCTHCGGSRHTKEGCFKLVGYPEWWDDLQKRRAATKAPASRTGGKANLGTTDQPTSCLKSCEPEGWSKGEGEVTVTTEQEANHGEKREWEEKGTVAVKQGKAKGTPNPKCPTTPFYNHQTLNTPPSQSSGPISIPRPNNSSGPQNTNSKGLLSHNTNSQWIFDCGETDTMTFDPSDFLSTHPTNRTHIRMANGDCVPVAHAGAVNISPSLHLKNCLLIPTLSHKLLSFSQLTKDLNCTVLLTSDNYCKTCVLAKSHKHSYSSSNTRAPKPFDVVHSDVWGPAPHTTPHGFSYFVLFIDDCSRI